jgi:hypothetical protein
MQKQQAKGWQHDWRRKVGERPTEQNQALFHKYVEYAHQVLEENQDAAFPYADVRQVCQPQYLFQVVSEMRSDKLSMRIYQNEEGLKLIVIHTVR